MVTITEPIVRAEGEHVQSESKHQVVMSITKAQYQVSLTIYLANYILKVKHYTNMHL